MAHPVCAKLLIAISEKGERGVSIRQLAEHTGEAKSRVRYHLDAMVESGLVGVASERSRGGVVERYFRAQQMPWISNDPLNEMDESEIRQIAVEISKAIFNDVTAAVRARTLGTKADETLVRLPVGC